MIDVCLPFCALCTLAMEEGINQVEHVDLVIRPDLRPLRKDILIHISVLFSCTQAKNKWFLQIKKGGETFEI